MIDDKMLEIIKREGEGRGGVDEWFIASSIYPWAVSACRGKHGAWINQVIRAGRRLQAKGLVGSFIVSHGEPGYNAPQTRIWFAVRAVEGIQGGLE